MSVFPLKADIRQRGARPLSAISGHTPVPLTLIAGGTYRTTCLLVGALEHLLAACLARRALGQEVVEPAGRHFRNGREQEIGVGMMRRGEDLALGALLNDAAITHDDDPVSDRLHRVVRAV